MEASGSNARSPAGCERPGSVGVGERGRGLKAGPGKAFHPGSEIQAERQHDRALVTFPYKRFAVGTEWSRENGRKEHLDHFSQICYKHVFTFLYQEDAVKLVLRK